MDAYQEYIHKSRYSRWLEEEKRRETWEETVQRYIDFFDNRTKKVHTDLLNGRIKKAILNLEVMPSMRAMMSAGEALERENLAGFNCSYLAVNNIEAFSEALYILMCGTGVGFSCERQEINQLPEVPSILMSAHDPIIVGDSKEGWATAFAEYLKCLYEGELRKVDYSKVRPAGARLKVFGGRASGPAPLERLMKFTKEIFFAAQGRKLNSLEVHDLMCMVGEIVVVGGVRRSALISLSNLSDQRMRDAKSGNWFEQNAHRGLANNSVAYTEKPSAEIFLDEWTSLVKSGSGERGIFNRVAAGKQAAKWGRRDVNLNYGTNPCCFTGDMELLTDQGYQAFKNLVNRDNFKIVSSDGAAEGGKVWSSGVKETVQLCFRSDRNPIICTPDHVFQLNDGSECEAKDLKGKRLKVFVGEGKRSYSDDDILAGFILGDGALNRLNSPAHKGLEVFFEKKDKDVADIFGVPIETWYSKRARQVALDYELPAAVIGQRGFPNLDLRLLKGLYSANGCVIKGHRVALKSIDKKQIEEVQFALKTYDIKAYITTNKPKKVKFKNGEYLCKESYDLNISTLDGIVSFAKNVGFVQSHKTEELHDLITKKSPHVSAVKEAGEQEVFDFTEPKNHWGVVEGMVVHNSEIILRDKQLCNLTEVVIRSTDSLEDLSEKVEIATILGTFQATLNKFGFVSNKWTENTAEEALLGVSFTGIMDHKVMSGSKSIIVLEGWLKILQKNARNINETWAETLGINPSAAITCVKPSGTVSQLCDTASGIHTRHNQHYIRTVRVDKKDPLYQFMIDQGLPTEDEQYRPDSTAVVSFPIKAPEGSVVRTDQTALEALDLWLIYQREWCEHKPSVTITVKDHEWLAVGAWVYEHFDEVSGISFLPHIDHTYVQAPYQDLTPDEYDDWIKKHPIPNIDWDKLSEYEKEDNTVTMQTLACVGGSCEI